MLTFWCIMDEDVIKYMRLLSKNLFWRTTASCKELKSVKGIFQDPALT